MSANSLFLSQIWKVIIDSDSPWKTASESIETNKILMHLYEFIYRPSTVYHETVYEKINQKTEMNQNGDIASSIEQNLLYKMH